MPPATECTRVRAPLNVYADRHMTSCLVYVDRHEKLPPQVRDNWKPADFARKFAHKTYPAWGLWHPVENQDDRFVVCVLLKRGCAARHEHVSGTMPVAITLSRGDFQVPRFRTRRCRTSGRSTPVCGPAAWLLSLSAGEPHASTADRGHQGAPACVGPFVLWWCSLGFVVMPGCGGRGQHVDAAHCREIQAHPRQDSEETQEGRLRPSNAVY